MEKKIEGAVQDEQVAGEVTFSMRGQKMAFTIGVQTFTLDYEPDGDEEFNFMSAMLTKAIHRAALQAQQPLAGVPLTLKELCAEFLAAAELNHACTITAQDCQTLFSAMTTPPEDAPAQPVFKTAPAIQSLPDAQGEVALAHAKIECLHFATDDVRLVIHSKCSTDEVRMHKDSAKFIVEAVASANRSHAAACVLADRQKRATAEPVAALTTEQIDAIANTFNWHNARCCGVHYHFARAIEQRLRAQPALTDDYANAKRYLWLRDPANIEGPHFIASKDPAELDAAIDAAILAGGAQPDAKGDAK
ncbi:MAG: hypothetical protein V4631_22040 [Pseudomonadota bacterium]